jgi:hypothetical protein
LNLLGTEKERTDNYEDYFNSTDSLKMKAKNDCFSCCMLAHRLYLQYNIITILAKKAYVITDINYQNNTVLMGRFDSITIPCIVPSIGCYDA